MIFLDESDCIFNYLYLVWFLAQFFQAEMLGTERTANHCVVDGVPTQYAGIQGVTADPFFIYFKNNNYFEKS